MMRKVGLTAVAILTAVGYVGAASADSTVGIDANRAALGLPMQARVGSCVYGSSCGAANTSNDSSQLAGAVPIIPLIAALGVVAGGVTLAAIKHHHHDYHYNPVSP
jgi:hypothetical protein